MARDPHLQRFAGSTDPGLEDGQSGSVHPMRAGSILVPWQHLKLVLHFVCELRESSLTLQMISNRRSSADMLGESKGGRSMPFYLTRFSYTPATWAKLMKNPEDRRAAAEEYIKGVGGKLHGFWYAFGDH